MLTDAIERLMSPLKIVVPVHELAMMMTIALSYTALIEETDKIMSAQRAGCGSRRNLIHRAKSLVPLLVPLFVSAFRRTDELATAMEYRCYRGGVGRTVQANEILGTITRRCLFSPQYRRRLLLAQYGLSKF